MKWCGGDARSCGWPEDRPVNKGGSDVKMKASTVAAIDGDPSQY